MSTPYLALARKYRPTSFESLVGQVHVQKALTHALNSNRLHHAYLFTGTRGVGKTTVARIFAKAINCLEGISASPCGKCQHCTEVAEGRFVDLIEVDAASRTKVEDTRQLLENVQYAPAKGRYKVYLIDEVHMLSTHSFNALLKTLEEPPEHVKFLLATTDPQKLPITVISRCLQFNLAHMSSEQIIGHLKNVLSEEEVAFEDEALWLLADAAEGSMRDALSLCDQAIAHGAGQLNASEVSMMLGTVSRGQLIKLVQLVASRDTQAVIETCERFRSMNADFRHALCGVMEIWQAVAFLQNRIPIKASLAFFREQLSPLSKQLDQEQVQLYYQITLKSLDDLAIHPVSSDAFEMAMLRLCSFMPASVNAIEITEEPVLITDKSPESLEEVDPPISISAQKKTFDEPESPIDEPVSSEPAPQVTEKPSPFIIYKDPEVWLDAINKAPLTMVQKQILLGSAVLDAHESQLLLGSLENPMITPERVQQIETLLGEVLESQPALFFEIRQKHTLPETAGDRANLLADHAHQARVERLQSNPKVKTLIESLNATLLTESVRSVEELSHE